MFSFSQILFFAFVIYFVEISSGSDSSQCKIPNQNETGHCVARENCTIYLELIKHENITNSRHAFLQQIQCINADNSDEIHVCCPLIGDYLDPDILITTPEIPRKPFELSSRFGDDLSEGTDICGTAVGENRIVGGETTKIDEFPWLALLIYLSRETNQFEHGCGGVLITKRFVLTAAHCVSGRSYKQVGILKKIRLGENNLYTNPDCDYIDGAPDCADTPLDFDPAAIIPHPKYDSISWDKFNDIALVKLNREAPYTDFIRTICLPSQYGITEADILNVQKLITAGWGRTDYFKKTRSIAPSSIKLKVALPVVKTPQCAKIYEQFTIRIIDSQICAGGTKGKDTCRGDSGSPLMYFNPRLAKWFVYGVVSKGPSECGTEGVPSVYTNVVKYGEWIKETVNNNS
uniref:CLIP domain-containing serine protease n=1 Tax=Corethrella appendiculata TaxID=1370023 RepID=U5EUT3_9DIPT